MRALYRPSLNGGKASDWLRPIPCQWEGDKLLKGAYQSGDGYSTGVHLSEHLACVPSRRRESSHVSSQGKEAASVTHDICTVISYIIMVWPVLCVQSVITRCLFKTHEAIRVL